MTATPTLPRVIAFYAYKGGTGRTTALLHSAWALARSGRRIVMLDLDLAAPSLWQLVFPGILPDDGFIEYMARAARSTDVDPSAFLRDVPLDDEAKGELRLFGAGRMDAAYLRELSTLDWSRLLAPQREIDANGQVSLATRSVFDGLLEHLASEADAVFIDAPTGLNDTANVCLRRLADLVVILFGPNRLQIEGVGRVVSLLADEQSARGKPEVLCVASTLHAHRLTLDLARRVEDAFRYLERVRYEALGRPALDDTEKLDAVEQSRVDVPYEAALADTDGVRLDRAPEKDDLRLYAGLIDWLEEHVPDRALPAPGCLPALDPTQKAELVSDLLRQFPQPVAEQETDMQAFLRTRHVQAVLDPTTVLIRGGKGSGKTALFKYCLKLQTPETKCIAVHGPGQGQLGMDVLSDMVERGLELNVVWRAYALARLPALPDNVPEAARAAADEVKRIVEGQATFDGRSTSLAQSGLGVEVDAAWKAVEADLSARRSNLMLFFDGLDTPFKGILERRRVGLSELFIAWRATFESLRRVQLKVFLRSDLWRELSFPEKSHVGTRSIELMWEPTLLWRLLLKRALRSTRFANRCEECGLVPPLPPDDVEDAAEPALLSRLDALIEKFIWTKKTALSRNWITRRLKDARENLYPRDALWLMRSALENEEDRSRNGRRTSNEVAISREALAAALRPTSEQRVQAVREESPELVDVLEWLRGFNAKGQLEDLRVRLSSRPGANAGEDLERLVGTGVLRVAEGEYSAAELYVPGLGMKRPGPK